MKIYLAHSSRYDYQHKLYEPLKQTIGRQHEVFYPHDEHEEGARSKGMIASSDVVLAEVSYPSTGQGIELGWADAAGVPIVCFYRADTQPSGALKFICDTSIPYGDTDEMCRELAVALQEVADRSV